MHLHAYQWVQDQTKGRTFGTVLEHGGLNINGSVRPLFAGASYKAIDTQDGPGVDLVADAAAYRPSKRVDCVVSCEVLEHAPKPKALIDAAFESLKRGGLLIVTCATDPREPHSGFDGGPVRTGEYYKNITPTQMKRWLKPFRESHVEVHFDRGDLYAWAVK